jgi:hypothetical protein
VDGEGLLLIGGNGTSFACKLGSDRRKEGKEWKGRGGFLFSSVPRIEMGEMTPTFGLGVEVGERCRWLVD